MTEKFNIDVSSALQDKSTIYTNIAQDIIVITHDKVENILLKKKIIPLSRSAWITPFAILLTTLATLATAQFKNWVFQADVWMALFIFISIGSLLWLMREIFFLYKFWGRDFDTEVMNDMKAQSISKT